MRDLTEEPLHAARWIAERIRGGPIIRWPSLLDGSHPVVLDYLSLRADARGHKPASSDEVIQAVRLMLVERLLSVERCQDSLDYAFEGHEPGDESAVQRGYVVRLQSGLVCGRRSSDAGWTTIYSRGAPNDPA